MTILPMVEVFQQNVTFKLIFHENSANFSLQVSFEFFSSTGIVQALK